MQSLLNVPHRTRCICKNLMVTIDVLRVMQSVGAVANASTAARVTKCRRGNKMDLEDIENKFADQEYLRSIGFMDEKHFEEYRNQVTQGLLKFGGNFDVALSVALRAADRNNALKILRYWAHLCEQHAILYRMFEAKQKSA